MRKILYTALCGDIDEPKPIHKPHPEWEYIFFTDRDDITHVDGWTKVVKIDSTDHPRLKAKLPKLLPHKYLPDHDWSIWVDAAYEVHGNPEYLMYYEADIVLTVHTSGRKTIFDEADVIMAYGRDEYANMTPQLERYKSEGFEGNYLNTIYQAGVIIRRNKQSVNNFNEDWYNEVRNGSIRDQLSLPYVLKKHNLNLKKTVQDIIDFCLVWKDHKQNNHNIFFISPYGFQLKIGDRLNYEIERLPEDAWIVLTDQDACFLTNKIGDQINAAITRYPDTDLFGCYTNRLGLGYQRLGDPNNYNLLSLHNEAEERQKKYYSICTDIDKPIAGFFMCFPRKTWERYKFQPEIIDKNKFTATGKQGVYFDWDFSERILLGGGKVKLMEGLFMLHCYRLGKHVRDVSHLLSKV